MKITHVRVGVLESGPGYNNKSVTLEAILEEGDNYAAVASELTAKCKSQIKGTKEIEILWDHVNDLRAQEKELRDLNAALRKQVDDNRTIIREHEKLAELATQEGIKHTLPFDDLLF
jgi:hypothetical protein